MDYLSLLFYSTGALAAGVAAVGTLRDRKAPGRILFSTALLVLATQCVLAGIIYTASPGQTAFWRSLWLIPQALSPSIWLLFVLRYSRGNFSTSIRKWLPFLIAAAVVPLMTITLFFESVLIGPEGGLPGMKIGFGGYILYLCIVFCAALVLINVERTFRAAVGTMRWRIKYVVLGTVVIFTAKLYTSSQVLLFKSHAFSYDIVNAVALLIASILFLIALLRTGLFRVQVYPSEQVLQFSVAGILIGGYLVLIGIFSKLFQGWQGPEAFALKAFLLLASLAVVAILLVSERSRDKLRRWISRHFHRPFYDYRSVWLQLTEKTASIQDPDTLCRNVAQWISEQLRVLSTSVWLVDPDSQTIRLAASTGMTAGHRELSSGIPELIQALSGEVNPFDLDKRHEVWARHLEPCFPDHFPGAGNRICVPLASAGRLIGFCTLGDRVNYIPLDIQEFELLKCVADQVAANLLNLQLSERVIRTREMEAFQTVAAFFVHDLKNTASTLNLTLQNLPKHFDNPEFRADALKAIGKSVSHIHELISRLTLFRQKLELNLVPLDLNSLIRKTLESIKTGEIPVSTELSPLSPVSGDADQLQKVLTNLVLNALDALKDNGRIEIKTVQKNGCAVLSVSDNGCGMSPEFIARSLFRPFQTTKKGGVGIGMFQTKAIVAAHQGRIEVSSTPGKGSEFRISFRSV